MEEEGQCLLDAVGRILDGNCTDAFLQFETIVTHTFAEKTPTAPATVGIQTYLPTLVMACAETMQNGEAVEAAAACLMAMLRVYRLKEGMREAGWTRRLGLCISICAIERSHGMARARALQLLACLRPKQLELRAESAVCAAIDDSLTESGEAARLGMSSAVEIASGLSALPRRLVSRLVSLTAQQDPFLRTAAIRVAERAVGRDPPLRIPLDRLARDWRERSFGDEHDLVDAFRSMKLVFDLSRAEALFHKKKPCLIATLGELRAAAVNRRSNVALCAFWPALESVVDCFSEVDAAHWHHLASRHCASLVAPFEAAAPSDHGTAAASLYKLVIRFAQGAQQHPAAFLRCWEAVHRRLVEVTPFVSHPLRRDLIRALVPPLESNDLDDCFDSVKGQSVVELIAASSQGEDLDGVLAAWHAVCTNSSQLNAVLRLAVDSPHSLLRSSLLAANRKAAVPLFRAVLVSTPPPTWLEAPQETAALCAALSASTDLVALFDCALEDDALDPAHIRFIGRVWATAALDSASSALLKAWPLLDAIATGRRALLKCKIGDNETVADISRRCVTNLGPEDLDDVVEKTTDALITPKRQSLHALTKCASDQAAAVALRLFRDARPSCKLVAFLRAYLESFYDQATNALDPLVDWSLIRVLIAAFDCKVLTNVARLARAFAPVARAAFATPEPDHLALARTLCCELLRALGCTSATSLDRALLEDVEPFLLAVLHSRGPATTLAAQATASLKEMCRCDHTLALHPELESALSAAGGTNLSTNLSGSSVVAKSNSPAPQAIAESDTLGRTELRILRSGSADSGGWQSQLRSRKRSLSDTTHTSALIPDPASNSAGAFSPPAARVRLCATTNA